MVFLTRKSHHPYTIGRGSINQRFRCPRMAGVISLQIRTVIVEFPFESFLGWVHSPL